MSLSYLSLAVALAYAASPAKLCAPFWFKLVHGAEVTPYVEAKKPGVFDGNELVMPNGKKVKVRSRGWGWATVEVPFKDFKFGQSSFDTSAGRIPGMLAHPTLLANILRDGLDYTAFLHEDGRVSIADAHHRTLSVAVRDLYGRLGKDGKKPGDKGYDEAAGVWMKKYLVPLMNLSNLPDRDFAKNAPRLMARMNWLEKQLGESLIPVAVPVWKGQVPLVTESSSMYGVRSLIFNQELYGVTDPARFPRCHPSVAEHNRANEILDLLDRDYPIP